MNIVLQIFYTVLILGILILVHEFGHFIVAKKSGIRVLEFALGMGPAIFKRKGKETLIHCPVSQFAQCLSVLLTAAQIIPPKGH